MKHVRTLAQADVALPPIVVHRVTMRIIDGVHRLHAAMLRGEEEIDVRFFDGNEADAFVLAVKANIAHGLPLSLADRKEAASRIVVSHPQWSDRMIASVTGLAAKTVATMRSRPTAENPPLDARVGRDGRVRPLNSAEGRRLAKEMITDNPNASLREIAQAAGISPETARNVRARLRRGEDPSLPRQRGHLEGRSSQGRLPNPKLRESPIQGTTGPGTSVMQTLRADPALRFTEAGRSLLRLLDFPWMVAERRQQLIDTVPPHSTSMVAGAARECADAWQRFAEQVERKIVIVRCSDTCSAGICQRGCANLSARIG